MTASDYIAIISAVGTVAITIVTLIVRRDVAGVQSGVKEVHELVNSKSKEQDRRIAQLTKALKTAGIVVPKDKAL